MASGSNPLIGEGGEEERTIYVRVERTAEQSPEGKQGEYDWYAIPDNDDLLSKDEDGYLIPSFKMPPKCHYMSASAALGPYIYVIGGLEEADLQRGLKRKIFGDVYYIDTRKPCKGWKHGRSLLKPRAQPHAAVVDGKIYVLAGLWNSDDPYAEFLDPQLTKWFPLPMHSDSVDLPHEMSSHAVIYDSVGRPQQLMAHSCFPRTFYSYEFASEKWSLASEEFGPYGFQAAFVGDVMYFVKGKVFAYHLIEGRWFSQPVRGLKKKVRPYHHKRYHMTVPSALVHVGNGVLCLLWCDKADHAYLPMDINCTKFTVSMEPMKETGELVPVAHVQSFKSYRVKGLFMDDCVVVSMSADNVPHLVKEEDGGTVKEENGGPFKEENGGPVKEEGGGIHRNKKKKSKRKKKGNNKLLVGATNGTFARLYSSN